MVENKNIDFACWINTQISASKISPKALAFDSGLRADTIYSYIRGDSVPELRSYKYICEAFAFHQRSILRLSKEEGKILLMNILAEGIKKL